MSSSMNYNERRLVRGLTNFESELWNTYFDPLLSCLICDPEKLVHLRWTNATPSEGGKSRPDSVISKRQQLVYKGSIGYGEAKVNQGSSSRYFLCMDTLRLAIFSKNAIDVNKLEGALAFQIHGFWITFFISRLVSNGIYAFYEVANLHFPESLEDLPPFISLKNITLLLAVNDVFWRLCKKSDKAVTITNRYWYVDLKLTIMTSLESPNKFVTRRFCDRIRAPLQAEDADQMKKFMKSLVLYKEQVENLACLINKEVNSALDRRSSFGHALGPYYKKDIPRYHHWLNRNEED
ncbi:hypothetical protein [Parasitella parasitica]|uniref:Uncharacterized protein n=1 Tax=Parasitella parasitica TaxID=35722 RepID=A0A0B7N325_9FUNG|nr:hypothetical protein [Parasitella parasitica]